jgi:hypothetical protein
VCLRPMGRWLCWPRLSWLVEVASLLAGYGLYSVTRVLVSSPGRTQEAMRHAGEVIRLEQLLGVCDELGLNKFITGREWLEVPASYFYASLHFLVTPAVLCWLWRRHPAVYGRLRSALVLTTLAALVVFAAWPLAPPRYALSGTSDTVLQHPALWAAGHGVSGFFNEFAAMPSLHVAWALWCAAAVTTALSSRWRRLVWFYPYGTVLVVVSTANHYLLDVAGAAAAVAVCWAFCMVREPVRSGRGRQSRRILDKAPATGNVLPETAL